MRNLKEDNIYLEMKPLGTEGAGAKALNVAARVGEAVVSVPVGAVQATTTAVLDATVHDTSQQMGVKEEK